MHRFLIAILLVVCALQTPTAFGQELKLATLAPDGSGWMEILRETSDSVHQATDGAVRIRFYPGGVMGDAATVLRRMRLGQLNGGAFTLGDLAATAPAAQLYSIPFLFRDASELEAVRAEFDPLILKALEDQGLIAAAISGGGFAYLFSRQPVPRADRVSTDFRVWIPDGDTLALQTLQAAGAAPVPMSMAEVYTGLQTGVINTFASTPSGAIILQWHSRARYVLDQPVVYTAGVVALDRRSVERLAPEHRVVLLDALAAAAVRLEERSARDNQSARAALEGQGIEFQRPDPEDAARWQDLAEKELVRLRTAGRIEVPHLDRLNERLSGLRGE